MKHSPYRPVGTADQSATSSLLPYWPHQTIRNMTTLAFVVGLISVISWQWGAPLPAPADPDLAYSPRPEWYFRWLFELRRHFNGNTEFIATLVIPTAFLAAFMAAPFLDRLLPARAGRICRLLIVAGCVGGWGWLTYLSCSRDWNDPEYMASVHEFELLSARAQELAQSESMPAAGAVELLRHDPWTQGPRLFARHCSSCHSMTDSNGHGIVASESSAPNLHGFGTVPWISGFLNLDRISSGDYFGKTAFSEGDMKQHIGSLFESAGDAGKSALQEKLMTVATSLAAEAGHVSQTSPEVQRGRELLVGELGCIDCHKFHSAGELGTAPDLTGYGSVEWLKAMISSPIDQRFYSTRNDRMPSFASDSSHVEFNLLSPRELDSLVKWMTVPHVHNEEHGSRDSRVPEKASPNPSGIHVEATGAVNTNIH